jgi:outer membrane receptor for ferrienterochelin and colicins
VGEKYRGDEVYESIYTKRWELLGAYELPHGRKNAFSFSIQTMTKTVYGDIPLSSAATHWFWTIDKN